uniref:WGS project CBME000000000 data, contig CS3487_c001817 n=1 Tax=Fusarium pseudograminearum CS3487 TaxID=1318458 RepID=A0A096PE86_FUSPS|nr:unnamed protein product [Fusarium pseudograminearum CS3487]
MQTFCAPAIPTRRLIDTDLRGGTLDTFVAFRYRSHSQPRVHRYWHGVISLTGRILVRIGLLDEASTGGAATPLNGASDFPFNLFHGPELRLTKPQESAYQMEQAWAPQVSKFASWHAWCSMVAELCTVLVT